MSVCRGLTWICNHDLESWSELNFWSPWTNKHTHLRVFHIFSSQMEVFIYYWWAIIVIVVFLVTIGKESPPLLSLRAYCMFPVIRATSSWRTDVYEMWVWKSENWGPMASLSFLSFAFLMLVLATPPLSPSLLVQKNVWVPPKPPRPWVNACHSSQCSILCKLVPSILFLLSLGPRPCGSRGRLGDWTPTGHTESSSPPWAIYVGHSLHWSCPTSAESEQEESGSRG